jgi:Tfp pilus assembly protein PilF
MPFRMQPRISRRTPSCSTGWAEAALAKGDIEMAEKSLRQAADLNPSRLDAEEELARIATQRGDMDLLSDVAEQDDRRGASLSWRLCVARHGGDEP